MPSFMHTRLARGGGVYLDFLPILFSSIGVIVLLITLVSRLLAGLLH